MTFWKIFGEDNSIFKCHKSSKPVGGVIDITTKPELKSIEPIDLSKVTFVQSPNCSKRSGDVKYLVLHHTGPGSFNGIVNWLCNKQAKASAHFVLGTTGQLKQLVKTEKEAWHAGVAHWNGEKINNHYSIGVEICNYGVLHKNEEDGNFYYEQGRVMKKYTGNVEPVPASITYPSGRVLEGFAVPYPDAQIDKLIGLCKALVQEFPQIGKDEILTHYEIASPEGRKNDPFGLDIDEVITRIFS